MIQLDDNNEIMALIVWRNKLTLVHVDEALLILDLPAWAEATVSELRRAADNASAQGKHAEAAEYSEASDALSRWLADMSQPISGWPMLLKRQIIAPAVVTDESYDKYARALIEHSTTQRAFQHTDISKVEVIVTASDRQYVSDRCEMLMSDPMSIAVDGARMGNIVGLEILRIDEQSSNNEWGA